jgi:hypothetical protein
MAKHYHKKHHHHRSRRNPFGLSTAVVQDAAVNAAGALGSLYLTNLLPSFSTGWGGVVATGGAAVAMSFAGKMVGGARVSEELLKGGLTATIIKALHQLGVAQNLGLGLYSPSLFAIPTASDQYLRAAAATDGGFRRGAGSIWFPGPGGQPVMALPAGIHPAAAAAAGMKGLGFHRFRSRYAGNY